MSGRYLEDFAVGQSLGSGRLKVEAAAIKSFAAEFDPQPFHLDDEAAKGSFFGGLAASGWHTVNRRRKLTRDRRPKLTRLFVTAADGSARPGGAGRGSVAQPGRARVGETLAALPVKGH